MTRRPPRSTRTDTPFPDTALFRALGGLAVASWRASRWALWVVGLLVLATSVWTFNESGLDIWAMLPRLGCLGLLAMALLILTIKGAFGGRPMNAKEIAGSAALLLLILFMPIAGLVVDSASPAIGRASCWERVCQYV